MLYFFAIINLGWAGFMFAHNLPIGWLNLVAGSFCFGVALHRTFDRK